MVDFVLRRARDTGRVRVLPVGGPDQAACAAQKLPRSACCKLAGAVAFTDGAQSDPQRACHAPRHCTYARDFDALVIHHAEDRDLAARA